MAANDTTIQYTQKGNATDTNLPHMDDVTRSMQADVDAYAKNHTEAETRAHAQELIDANTEANERYEKAHPGTTLPRRSINDLVIPPDPPKPPPPPPKMPDPPKYDPPPQPPDYDPLKPRADLNKDDDNNKFKNDGAIPDYFNILVQPATLLRRAEKSGGTSQANGGNYDDFLKERRSLYQQLFSGVSGDEKFHGGELYGFGSNADHTLLNNISAPRTIPEVYEEVDHMYINKDDKQPLEPSEGNWESMGVTNDGTEDKSTIIKTYLGGTVSSIHGTTFGNLMNAEYMPFDTANTQTLKASNYEFKDGMLIEDLSTKDIPNGIVSLISGLKNSFISTDILGPVRYGAEIILDQEMRTKFVTHRVSDGHNPDRQVKLHVPPRFSADGHRIIYNKIDPENGKIDDNFDNEPHSGIITKTALISPIVAFNYSGNDKSKGKLGVPKINEKTTDKEIMDYELMNTRNSIHGASSNQDKWVGGESGEKWDDKEVNEGKNWNGAINFDESQYVRTVVKEDYYSQLSNKYNILFHKTWSKTKFDDTKDDLGLGYLQTPYGRLVFQYTPEILSTSISAEFSSFTAIGRTHEYPIWNKTSSKTFQFKTTYAILTPMSDDDAWIQPSDFAKDSFNVYKQWAKHWDEDQVLKTINGYRSLILPQDPGDEGSTKGVAPPMFYIRFNNLVNGYTFIATDVNIDPQINVGFTKNFNPIVYEISMTLKATYPWHPEEPKESSGPAGSGEDSSESSLESGIGTAGR